MSIDGASDGFWTKTRAQIWLCALKYIEIYEDIILMPFGMAGIGDDTTVPFLLFISRRMQDFQAKEKARKHGLSWCR